jgi:hypothetical protein
MTFWRHVIRFHPWNSESQVGLPMGCLGQGLCGNHLGSGQVSRCSKRSVLVIPLFAKYEFCQRGRA